MYKNLKAKLNAQIAERLSAKVEAVLNNPIIQEGMIVTGMLERTIDKLKETDALCSGIVEAMPIYSTRTRETRKWSPSPQFGLSTEISAIIRLLTGIQYSAADHKNQMLAVTGLSEPLIEATLDSLGSLPYYNRNYAVIVDGKSMDTVKFAVNIQLVALALGVTVDTSFLTDKLAAKRISDALLTAEKNKLAAEVQIAIGATTISC